MEVIELIGALDDTTTVVVLVVFGWRLMSQVDVVITATKEVIDRLIDLQENDSPTRDEDRG